MSDFNNEQSDKYKSVGGWLKFLCIILTIISPLRTVSYLFKSYIEISPVLNEFHGLRNLFLTESFLTIVLMILSVRAGLYLWNIEDGAVKVAKNYLLIFFGLSVISTLLPFAFEMPPGVNEPTIFEIVKYTILYSIFPFIWYWYLDASERVKATYKLYPISEDLESSSNESVKSDNTMELKQNNLNTIINESQSKRSTLKNTQKTIFNNLMFYWLLIACIISISIWNGYQIHSGVTYRAIPIMLQIILLYLIFSKNQFAKLGIKIWSIYLVATQGIQLFGIILLTTEAEKINYTSILSALLLLIIGILIFNFNNKTVEVKITEDE